MINKCNRICLVCKILYIKETNYKGTKYCSIFCKKKAKNEQNKALWNKKGKIYRRTYLNSLSECKKKKYLEAQKKSLKKSRKKHYKKNKLKYYAKKYNRIFTLNDLSKLKKLKKIKRANRNKYTKEKSKYMYEYLKTHLNVKIGSIFRQRIWRILKGKNVVFNMEEIIGCTLMELKIYLENKFQKNMSWNNYGQFGWHIDHIEPCCNFDFSNIEQLKKCFHYTNLQPLWWMDNLKKGSGSLFFERKKQKKCSR